MAPTETLDWTLIPQFQKDNIATALEYFTYSRYTGLLCDERIEGDRAVRRRFRIEGKACDLVLRVGKRFTLAEAKGEQDIGTARLQFENTISAIVRLYRGAVFGSLAVYVRRGPVYSTLPLNSTEGLGKYLEIVDLSETGQFRFESAHLARKNDQNRHVLLEPSGDPCLPIPKSSGDDRWGINRVVPPEIRVFVTSFRLPS
jgi:hypothetical protein